MTEDERTCISIEHFSLSVPDGQEEAFLDDIENVCKKYAGNDYLFQWKVQ